MIALRDFDLKLALLIDGLSLFDDLIREPSENLLKVGEALRLSPLDVLRQAQERRLSIGRVPALLRLFGLPVRDWKRTRENEMSAEERGWLELAREPLAAFCARVRLAGGTHFGCGAGQMWDRFVRSLAHNRYPTTRQSFEIIARHPDDWLRRHKSKRGPHAGLLARDVTPSAWATGSGLPRFAARHWAKIFLDTRQALPDYDVHRYGAFVFMFQDVVIRGRRRIIPLVPYPTDSSVTMPPERVEGVSAVLQIPLSGRAHECLEIPVGWGVQRSIFAVITDQPLDDEIVGEGRTRRELRLERLDLLAARFLDETLWPSHRRTVWEFPYEVFHPFLDPAHSNTVGSETPDIGVTTEPGFESS